MKNDSDRNAETQWIDDRLASLEPPSTWHPNAGRALDQLAERRNGASTFRWGPMSMAATLIVATGLVLLFLPWQVLLKSVSEAKPSLPAEQLDTAATPEAQTVQTETKQLPMAVEEVTKVTPFPKVPQATTAAAAPSAVPEPVVGVVQNQETSPPYAVGQGVTAPKVISKVQPEYTEEAKRARLQGTIEAVCIIKEDGTVQVRELTKTLGYGLDESAIAALSQWRFEPGTKDGKPVPVQTSILLHFLLR